MVVKVYISGISGNKEVKKRQQRVCMILDSRCFKYELVDIAEPGNEPEKDFMQSNSTALGATIGDANPRHPLPPQIFNDTSYCGDYDKFDLANEIDELEKFLKLAPDDSMPAVTSSAEIQLSTTNGATPDASKEEDTNEAEALDNSNEAESVQQETHAEVNGRVDSGVTQEEADGNAEVDDGVPEDDA